MNEDKLKDLLNELAQRAKESPRPGLAEDIKHQIPPQLYPHKIARNTVNIIIDLRIHKLTAAAVIILTLVLCASFFRGRDTTGDNLYQDSKLLIKYCLGGENATRSNVLAGLSRFYEYLVHQGKDVVYYGDNINPQDRNAILMHWRLPDGKYKVIFGDLRMATVSPDTLIILQARMLQDKAI